MEHLPSAGGGSAPEKQQWDMRLQKPYGWHVDELPSVLRCNWCFMTVAFFFPMSSQGSWRDQPGSKPEDLGLCMANYCKAWWGEFELSPSKEGPSKNGIPGMEEYCAGGHWQMLGLYFFWKKTSLLSFFRKKKKRRGCGCAFELCCSGEICES